MNEMLYDMIFKRKSFHIFRDVCGVITNEELDLIYDFFAKTKPLVDGIKTEMRIVPASETTYKLGEEYCILFYSEKKDNYLQNIGYIGEQIDLFLASVNIGALWFGTGKPNQPKYNGLDFIIMIAIAKMPEDKFREDMFKAKRKPIDEIWNGNMTDYANTVRFAPSACNTQPWIVSSSNEGLKVYRYKKPGKHGIMPADRVRYYNRIDMGIFMCFLDLCLQHDNKQFEHKLYVDDVDDSVEKVLTTEYVWK